MSTVKKILKLLSCDERRRGYLLLVMIIILAIIDAAGVASIMPFMSVLANPDMIEANYWLRYAYTTLGFDSAARFTFFLGMVVLAFLVTSIAFRALTTYMLLQFTHMRNYSLSKRLVAAYLYQSYDWFLGRHSADLGKSVLLEVQQVINGAVVPLMQALAHGTLALVLLLLLMIVDPVLAITGAAVLGSAYSFIYIALRRYLSRIGEDRVQANRERFEAVQETFGGIKDVKVAALEEVMLNRYDDPAKRFAVYETFSDLASTLPRFLLEVISFTGILSVALYLVAKQGGLQDALPILSLYAFAGYRLLPALQQVYFQVSKIRFAGPAVDALYLDYESLYNGRGKLLFQPPPAPMGIQKSICLENIHYNYPGAGKPAISGLNITIPANTTLGLVGATGSGKTTTVDIILGLLHAQVGQISVDDTAITPENVRAWQRTIGYVPQQIYLSDDTVAANIAFGLRSEQIDLEAVEQAARIANLHTFVTEEMPEGYNTWIGERGVRLSGGQRQRIGIARALYHDPPVLILDEATSALDNVTEQVVMESVRRLGNTKTIIIIAHRLTTVQSCDKIAVLQKGQLIGQGTYGELLKHSPIFKAMAINK